MLHKWVSGQQPETFLGVAQDLDVRAWEYMESMWGGGCCNSGMGRELGAHFWLDRMLEVLVLLDILSLTVGCWEIHIFLPANEKQASI